MSISPASSTAAAVPAAARTVDATPDTTPDTTPDVSATGSTTAATGATRLRHVEHDEGREVEGDDDGDEGAEHGERARVSEHGRSYGELASLSSSDPDLFKSITTDISDRLRSAASGLSAGQGNLLTSLADQFSKASQTGQLEALQLGTKASREGHHGVRRYAAQQESHAAKGVDISDLLKGVLKAAYVK